MQWQCLDFNQLTNQQIWQMYHIRAVMFCVQQNRTFVDADDNDLTAKHILATKDGKLVAYARFYGEKDYLSFGRVLTVPEVRGTGMGKQLMDYLMMQIAKYNTDQKDIIITAQLDKQGFYEKFGFASMGEPFMHEQSMHIMMKYNHKL
ncbi:GNAT family N-acetyltransferase [Apilactobacillus xinyiensis]|uniref:GNAT family N-acetyltransferase n=1 Tax=Apilactobacillus xinyiensis TaxID=2841032 RepID=UPI00200C7627|nr:GNAT family N-acetyltransferase [Apilactobacillus xinyiensis]MCL0329787.1 GNAT family N-acetyltransferase [Apilactobacillus xinyiensis]